MVKPSFILPDGTPLDLSPPPASATEAGLVQPDGKTITVNDDGVISVPEKVTYAGAFPNMSHVNITSGFVAPSDGYARLQGINNLTSADLVLATTMLISQIRLDGPVNSLNGCVFVPVTKGQAINDQSHNVTVNFFVFIPAKGAV
jgi:hypothetical protein